MTNEPAFPVGVDVTQNQWKPSFGMSLRDYFAAKTLQGLMANVSANNWVNPYDNLAESSYEMADAMLKARQEQ